MCRRFNGSPYAYPVSIDILKLRVNIDYAFSEVGIDYMGPLYYKNVYVNDLEDDKMHKCFGILCAYDATRGVVLDVVIDAPAGTWLLSLTWYISCWDWPKQVLTDNGPVFALNKVQLFAARRNIKRGHLTNYKRGHSQHFTIIIVYEEKQPQQPWQMCKIVEFIESKDKNIPELLIGKTQNVVRRPINHLYPAEFSEEFDRAVQNEVEINERTKTRRKAAVPADLKQKFIQ